MARFEILRQFIAQLGTEREKWYDEWMIYDLYLRENSKSRPSWAPDPGQWKEFAGQFYKKEEENPYYLKEYKGYNHRQMAKMTHLEIFSFDVLGDGKKQRTAILFDYKKRNPLTNDSAVFLIKEAEIM